ncbi:phage tail protein [Acinetobacter qingfengensis]|uniref:Phage tail protein n=1 Tax=Acinetobacter qingfengensis TaxID=1262585 RepID=A0A1E7RCA3_9GAMM|nr:phage tail protein [Acinetobacter qingfengensis]KAA8734909.1 phage tail protein [Acinetobacter qingfengensis]OEY96923.1 phage tail protein [Acinetobacter qingfengensis]
MSKTVYQYNYAGLYTGTTEADESPLEPGVFLLPANSTEIHPPKAWPEDQWPRFDGQSWQLITKPTQQTEKSAEEKLVAFLNDNPDVMKLMRK